MKETVRGGFFTRSNQRSEIKIKKFNLVLDQEITLK